MIHSIVSITRESTGYNVLHMNLPTKENNKTKNLDAILCQQYGCSIFGESQDQKFIILLFLDHAHETIVAVSDILRSVK